MAGKTLQELTIKDNFMFGAVMLQENNCTGLLRLVLGIDIDHVEISTEKSLIYHPEYRGVRLDVYARDDNNSIYNVEMQIQPTDIEKRSRYYHSHMDMELLGSGIDYDNLPNSFVIFICDYDPLGYGKYIYTVKNTCLELPGHPYEDGSYSIFLSTRGTNTADVPGELVTLMQYIGSDLTESEQDYNDPYVAQLQQSVHTIKHDRRMEERYMTLEMMLRQERKDGFNDGFNNGFSTGQLNHMISLVRKKVLKSKSVTEIAKELESDEDLISQIVSVILSNPLCTDEDIVNIISNN